MRIKIFWMKKSFTEFSLWFKAEVEKVKRVSGNLRIGPKTAKMKESVLSFSLPIPNLVWLFESYS